MTRNKMEALLEKLLVADREYIANLDKMVKLPNSTPKYKIGYAHKNALNSLNNSLKIQQEILNNFN